MENVVQLGSTMSEWDEFNPALYTLQVNLNKGMSRWETVFGMRQVKVKEKSILVNWKRTF